MLVRELPAVGLLVLGLAAAPRGATGDGACAWPVPDPVWRPWAGLGEKDVVLGGGTMELRWVNRATRTTCQDMTDKYPWPGQRVGLGRIRRQSEAKTRSLLTRLRIELESPATAWTSRESLPVDGHRGSGRVATAQLTNRQPRAVWCLQVDSWSPRGLRCNAVSLSSAFYSSERPSHSKSATT
jgi:hypothetical protein